MKPVHDATRRWRDWRFKRMHKETIASRQAWKSSKQICTSSRRRDRLRHKVDDHSIVPTRARMSQRRALIIEAAVDQRVVIEVDDVVIVIVAVDPAGAMIVEALIGAAVI